MSQYVGRININLGYYPFSTVIWELGECCYDSQYYLYMEGRTTSGIMCLCFSDYLRNKAKP